MIHRIEILTHSRYPEPVGENYILPQGIEFTYGTFSLVIKILSGKV